MIRKFKTFLSLREEGIEFETYFSRFFRFRLPIRLSSENAPVSGEDIQTSAGSEQSYPVLRSMDLEGKVIDIDL